MSSQKFDSGSSSSSSSSKSSLEGKGAKPSSLDGKGARPSSLDGNGASSSSLEGKDGNGASLQGDASLRMVCLERNDPSVDCEPLRIRLPPDTVDAVVDTVWILFFERKDEIEFFLTNAVGVEALLGERHKASTLGVAWASNTVGAQ